MKKIVCAAGVVALLTTSCSSTGVSGLPSGKKLAELTDEDVKTACEETKSSPLVTEQELKRVACVGAGAGAISASIPQAQWPDACQAAYDNCVNAATTTKSTDCSAQSASQFAGCQATVEEYEACLQEHADAVKAFSFNCKDAIQGTGKTDQLKPGQKCEAFAQLCPKIEI